MRGWRCRRFRCSGSRCGSGRWCCLGRLGLRTLCKLAYVFDLRALLQPFHFLRNRFSPTLVEKELLDTCGSGSFFDRGCARRDDAERRNRLGRFADLYVAFLRGMVRHKVKPGVTGWAQVNGLRGETDTIEKMQARVECDLAYLRMWSVGLDIRIVFKTALVILASGDTY